MTVKVGDALPDVTVKTWEDGVADLSIGALTEGKTAVIFGLPGAFTPTCSIRHLPGFVDHAEALMAKGVDRHRGSLRQRSSCHECVEQAARV